MYCVYVSMSMYGRHHVRQCGKKKKKEDEVYFAFFIFWPFFCCKLISVIDPVASLARIAFGCPTCLDFRSLVQRVFYL